MCTLKIQSNNATDTLIMMYIKGYILFSTDTSVMHRKTILVICCVLLTTSPGLCLHSHLPRISLLFLNSFEQFAAIREVSFSQNKTWNFLHTHLVLRKAREKEKFSPGQ